MNYYQKNKEKILQKKQIYYQKNKKRILKEQKKYKKQTKEYQTAYQTLYRFKKWVIKHVITKLV